MYNCGISLQMHKQKMARENMNTENMSEFEYSLTVLSNGFLRWVVRCGEAAGVKNLGPVDLLVLHTVNYRARNKKLAEICLVMNVTESHTIAYSLKKLRERNLVDYKYVGRDRIFYSSDSGDLVCKSYLEMRRAGLLSILESSDIDIRKLFSSVSLMNRMSSAYAEAERKVTLISSKEPIK